MKGVRIKSFDSSDEDDIFEKDNKGKRKKTIIKNDQILSTVSRFPSIQVHANDDKSRFKSWYTVIENLEEIKPKMYYITIKEIVKIFKDFHEPDKENTSSQYIAQFSDTDDCESTINGNYNLDLSTLTPSLCSRLIRSLISLITCEERTFSKNISKRSSSDLTRKFISLIQDVRTILQYCISHTPDPLAIKHVIDHVLDLFHDDRFTIFPELLYIEYLKLLNWISSNIQPSKIISSNHVIGILSMCHIVIMDNQPFWTFKSMNMYIDTISNTSSPYLPSLDQFFIILTLQLSENTKKSSINFQSFLIYQVIVNIINDKNMFDKISYGSSFIVYCTMILFIFIYDGTENPLHVSVISIINKSISRLLSRFPFHIEILLRLIFPCLLSLWSTKQLSLFTELLHLLTIAISMIYHIPLSQSDIQCRFYLSQLYTNIFHDLDKPKRFSRLLQSTDPLLYYWTLYKALYLHNQLDITHDLGISEHMIYFNILSIRVFLAIQMNSITNIEDCLLKRMCDTEQKDLWITFSVENSLLFSSLLNSQYTSHPNYNILFSILLDIHNKPLARFDVKSSLYDPFNVLLAIIALESKIVTKDQLIFGHNISNLPLSFLSRLLPFIQNYTIIIEQIYKVDNNQISIPDNFIHFNHSLYILSCYQSQKIIPPIRNRYNINIPVPSLSFLHKYIYLVDNILPIESNAIEELCKESSIEYIDDSIWNIIDTIYVLSTLHKHIDSKNIETRIANIDCPISIIRMIAPFQTDPDNNTLPYIILNKKSNIHNELIDIMIQILNNPNSKLISEMAKMIPTNLSISKSIFNTWTSGILVPLIGNPFYQDHIDDIEKEIASSLVNNIKEYHSIKNRIESFDELFTKKFDMILWYVIEYGFDNNLYDILDRIARIVGKSSINDIFTFNTKCFFILERILSYHDKKKSFDMLKSFLSCWKDGYSELIIILIASILFQKDNWITESIPFFASMLERIDRTKELDMLLFEIMERNNTTHCFSVLVTYYEKIKSSSISFICISILISSKISISNRIDFIRQCIPFVDVQDDMIILWNSLTRNLCPISTIDYSYNFDTLPVVFYSIDIWSYHLFHIMSMNTNEPILKAFLYLFSNPINSEEWHEILSSFIPLFIKHNLSLLTREINKTLLIFLESDQDRDGRIILFISRLIKSELVNRSKSILSNLDIQAFAKCCFYIGDPESCFYFLELSSYNYKLNPFSITLFSSLSDRDLVHACHIANHIDLLHRRIHDQDMEKALLLYNTINNNNILSPYEQHLIDKWIQFHKDPLQNSIERNTKWNEYPPTNDLNYFIPFKCENSLQSLKFDNSLSLPIESLDYLYWLEASNSLGDITNNQISISNISISTKAESLIKQIRLTRKHSFFALANASLLRFKELVSTNNEYKQVYTLEEAKNLWALGDHDLAISWLHSSNSPSSLVCLGSWLDETKSLPPSAILANYFTPALEMIQVDDNKNIGKIYYKVAKFCDDQYKLSSNSKELETWYMLVHNKNREIEECKKRISYTIEEKERQKLERTLQGLIQQCNLDKSEYEKAITEAKEFLSKAFELYLRCMTWDSIYVTTSLFRLCSLWFSHTSDQYTMIIELIDKYIFKYESISYDRFIPLIYQLTARLGENKIFSKQLFNLIYKIALIYPFHTIPQVIAMRNSNEQKKSSQELIVLLSNSSNRFQKILHEYERIFQAYIELGMKQVKETIPKSLLICQLGQLKEIPVMTISIPIRPSDQYDDFIYVCSFDTKINMVGGINLPKVVKCLASDGRYYKQVVKSRDDLRQDAVMVQMFSIIDTFLKKAKECRNRQLGIRAYKVVPLQPLCGLLEWVDEAVPIGDYLSDAHKRYFRNDLTSNEARNIMKEEFDREGSNCRSKLVVYNKILSRFHPVLRNFFLETFLVPTEWFKARLRFIRSVAVTSIIGYIVGLGDRHCQNILIDKCTADVIHVDLNMIFDQGKLLKIPEQVPFRLTPDIIDGFGMTGVDGTFKRTCEEILGLARSKSDLIITILEVFKYDNLYRWSNKDTININREESIVKSLMHGNIVYDIKHGNETVHPEAERALLRVKEKLEGIEQGWSALSVKGHVNYLIQQASNPELLCQMYPGWQPWM